MSSAMVVNGKLARYPDPPQIYHTRPARTKPRIGRLRKPMLLEDANASQSSASAGHWPASLVRRSTHEELCSKRLGFGRCCQSALKFDPGSASNRDPSLALG